MKSFVFIAVYCALVGAPLALSWAVGGPPRELRDELATGLGILAFSILLVEFVLSGRSKTISKSIGMDVIMRVHQLAGRVALVFALLHPFMYQRAPAGGPRPWDPTRQLTVTTDFSDLVSGIGAFVLLPSLVLLAVGRTQLDYKYETWRVMHGIGALLIALLLLHHVDNAGRYAATSAAGWLWVGMTTIAAGMLAYVYVAVPLLQNRRAWQVTDVTQLTPKQWQLTVTPSGPHELDYEAGQFVWLNVGHSPFSMRENPFSIASAPACGDDVSFMIKELGDFTQTMGKIEPGTTAYLDGPYGSLTVEGRTEPGVALIAGGVGLAPLIGILRQMRQTKDQRDVKLIYGNRTEAQIAYRKELGQKGITYVLSEPPEGWDGETGFIDGAVLDRVFTSQDYQKWVFVMCGPAVMMDVVEQHLKRKGVASGRILSERFDYD